MLFTSPVFLLLFLPLMLGIYTLTPPRLRPRAILAFSLAFYTLACFESPASLLFILLCAIFTYCAAFAVFSVIRTYPIVMSTKIQIYITLHTKKHSAKGFPPRSAVVLIGF